MGKYFGTDGVRGIANIELTPEFVYKLGKCGAYVLTKNCEEKPKIIIGCDTRISGNLMKAALVAGICCVGVDVIYLGVIPTPAVAYLIKKYKANAGIVISASHNTFSDNGIKFFNEKGYKLSDILENEIEDFIENRFDEIQNASSKNIGTEIFAKDAIYDYCSFIKDSIDIDFSGLKIAVDCANGSTYKVAPAILKDLGATIDTIFCEPNGININSNCGSTHTENLSKHVLDIKADIGIAFDGDGDRCLAIDENGELIDGDQILAICGKYLSEKGKLKNNRIVATVMSNLGLFKMGEENGISIEKANVGDRYVLEMMLKERDCLGGEQSGHIIFLDYNTTGDGVLTAIKLISILKESGKKLSELKQIMKVLPQVIVNARVDNKKKKEYLNYSKITQGISELEEKFSKNGRVIIRPSGTEPIIRVMVEGTDIDILNSEAKKLASIIESELK